MTKQIDQQLKYNQSDIHIDMKLDLADRINTITERESFITLKDHKEDFKNKPTCQLINSVNQK